MVAGTPCIVANFSALVEWIDDETCFGIDYPIRLDELLDVIICIFYGKVQGNVISEKLVGKKILDWNEVVRLLEDVYSG